MKTPQTSVNNTISKIENLNEKSETNKLNIPSIINENNDQTKEPCTVITNEV